MTKAPFVVSKRTLNSSGAAAVALWGDSSACEGAGVAGACAAGAGEGLWAGCCWPPQAASIPAARIKTGSVVFFMGKSLFFLSTGVYPGRLKLRGRRPSNGIPKREDADARDYQHAP